MNRNTSSPRSAAEAVIVVGPMSPNQPPPNPEAFDTSEIELPSATELDPRETQQGRPSWDPENGDFN
jgi:hypothetical protein